MSDDWREQVDNVPVVDDDYGAGRGHCTTCGTQWDGHDICHCAACHLTFTSFGPFDAHRVAGQCRSESELRERGYQPNSRDQWRKPRPLDSIPGDSNATKPH